MNENDLRLPWKPIARIEDAGKVSRVRRFFSWVGVLVFGPRLIDHTDAIRERRAALLADGTVARPTSKRRLNPQSLLDATDDS